MATTATPVLDDQQILEHLNTHFNLNGQISVLPSYADLNRALTDENGNCWVVKIANVNHSRQDLEFENQMMQMLEKSDILFVAVPELKDAIENHTPLVTIQDAHGRNCFMRVISLLPGKIWGEATIDSLQYISSLGKVLGSIDRVFEDVQHSAGNKFLAWDIKHAPSIIEKYISIITDASQQTKIQSVLDDYTAYVLPSLYLLPTQVIHNDANDYNLLVSEETKTVSGIFDFGDMVNTFRIAELAIASAYAIMGNLDLSEVLISIVTAYHQANPLTDTEVEVLINMIRARLAVSVCMSSHQYSLMPENDYLVVSQQGAWRALDALATIDKTSLTLKLKYLCGLTNKNSDNSETIIQYRKNHLSENLSLAYHQPLKIIEGKKSYLYSESGRRYLDMVNNVCHVGHCHPKVVSAGQRQMAKLNTNTRYLHDNIIEFSKKLLATMPAPLSVCMFVNSGTEANELALRLARNYTNRHSMVVVEGAYHGNSNACIDISPYKFDGPGGHGEPDWVKQTIVPDPYRGKYRGRTEKVGRQYALDVKRVAKEFADDGNPICAFICESIQGVGGQIIHPPSYLKQAYQYIREAGGVCIADEVQVGMGRVGSHWWAFETQDAVPDIITIGKPLGNGHPLAAVVTTKEIAEKFATGMEYFNTFGGNPVSCAIGCAVLDTIQEEGLQAHAQKIGTLLVAGLERLKKDFPVIGDVRGMGMFIGAEFVTNSETLNPAISQIDYVIERLKDEGILLTTEGPFHNVLKIKPPLSFTNEDAEYFLKTLRNILAEDGAKII